MWNGLWKLTAMVGVIGVGLFAAYQAQKGMNLSVASAPSDPGVGDANSERALASTDENPLADPLAEQQEPAAVADSDLEPIDRNSKRQKKVADRPADPLSDFDADPPPVKKAVASSKTPGQIIPVKRTQRQPGVDFRQEAEPTFDGSNDTAAEPKRLPDEEPLTATSPTKKSRDPVVQVNAASTDEPAAIEDAAADPFAEDNLAAAGNAPAKKNSPAARHETATTDQPAIDSADPLNAEPAPQAPGRARISTDFGTDSAPPRSKRAKQNAGKRGEAPADVDSNPLDSASQTPAALPDSQPGNSAAELGAPQAIHARDDVQDFPGDPKSKLNNQIQGQKRYSSDREEADRALKKEPIGSDPNFGVDPRPASAPRNLPSDQSVISSDGSLPTRSPPGRTIPALPTQLPDEPNGGYLSEPPLRSREARSRSADYDRVTPVDMVGDGVAGDVSQRGLQQPRLTIEKVAQQQAVLDQPLVYTIIVKNTGTVDAHNVVIEDRIPKGTKLEGTSPQAELSGKRLIWNHLVLKPNEEKRISIKVTPQQEGPIGSVARVYFATEVTAEIVVNAPQLEFTVKAPSEVRVGQHFDLVFNLKNVGKVDASNIIVRDLVPEQLKHENGADIECPIGKMAPQEVREIVLPVTAMKTGSLVNKAIMTADSGVKKSLDSSIDVVGEVLVLTRSGQNRLYVERSAVFTNNIRNDGNQRADSVRIAEVVPAGMVFETASDGGKYDANLKAVVWTVGPLAPGNDKTVSVKYTPKETGTHPAKITATGSAGSTAAVQSTVDVIGKPELQMETMSATGVVTVGDRITSKFQLNNTGTAAATNVQLRVRLPRELRLISVKGANFQQKDDYVQFEIIGDLPPRTKAAYELVLEPIAEADAQISLEISADHLSRPGRRVETIQIARDALK